MTIIQDAIAQIEAATTFQRIKEAWAVLFPNEIENIEIEKTVRDMNLFPEVNQNQRLPADGLLSTISIRQLLEFVKDEHKPVNDGTLFVPETLKAKGITTDTNIDGKVIELKGNGRVARLRNSGIWQLYEKEELYDTAKNMNEAVEMLLESAFNDQIILDEDPSKTIMKYDWHGRIEAAKDMEAITEVFEVLFPGSAAKSRTLTKIANTAKSLVSILQDPNADTESQYNAVKAWYEIPMYSLDNIEKITGINTFLVRQQARSLEIGLPKKMLDAYILESGEVIHTIDKVAVKEEAYDKAYSEINRMQQEIEAKYKPEQDALDEELKDIEGNKKTWSKFWGDGNWQYASGDVADKYRPWTPESVDAFVAEYRSGITGFNREISTTRNSKPFLQKRAEELAALPWEEMRTDRLEFEKARKEAFNSVVDSLLKASPVSEAQAAEWSKANVIYDKSAMAKAAKGGYSRKDVERDVMTFYRLTGGRLPRLEFSTSGKARSNAAHWSGVLNVGSSFGKGTLYHELAHLLEDDEKIKAVAIAFRDSRRESEALYPLKELVPYSNYDKKELAYKDTWVDPYVGKDYGQTATEVISMGMQHLTNPDALWGLHKADPEHLAFMLGLCVSKPVIDVDATARKQAATQEKASQINGQEEFLKKLDKEIAKAGDFYSADGYEIATSSTWGKKRTEIRYNKEYDEQGELRSYSNYTLKSEKIAKRALFIWYKAGKPSKGEGTGDLNLGNIVWQLGDKRQKVLPGYILQTQL